MPCHDQKGLLATSITSFYLFMINWQNTEITPYLTPANALMHEHSALLNIHEYLLANHENKFDKTDQFIVNFQI